MGDRRQAAILGLPPLFPLIPLFAALMRGADGLLAHLVVPGNALILTVAIVVGLVFRLVAIWLIWQSFEPPVVRSNRRLVTALAVVVLTTHLVAAYGAFGLFGVTTRVFSGRVDDIPDPSQPTASLGAVVLPSAPPPLPPDERFSILLVGSDFGTGYHHSLTDTMMVISVDPPTGGVVMVSVPRDTARFPFYRGGTYDGKLNSLMTRADLNPKEFPDGGLGTLSNEISYLIGIPIQYVAYINLGGFEKLIDAVGGIDVVVTRAIDDTFYQFPNGPKGFHLAAGPAHLDSAHAVAYVRSRYGAGDNDFTRARRQQDVLLALKTKLTSPSVLPNLPHILDVMSHLISTNFPADQVDRILELSKQVQSDGIQRFVLGPPYAIRPPGLGEYVLVPDMNRIAKWSIKTFGASSRYATAPTP
jgi:polyisoprenyl-teichoic acid--peptidoglycan teichoic acid transferase